MTHNSTIDMILIHIYTFNMNKIIHIYEYVYTYYSNVDESISHIYIYII